MKFAYLLRQEGPVQFKLGQWENVEKIGRATYRLRVLNKIEGTCADMCQKGVLRKVLFPN